MMKSKKGYGVITKISSERKIGTILSSTGEWLTFLLSDAPGLRDDVTLAPLPVHFTIASHPWQPERYVAKNVLPLVRPAQPGTVALSEPTYGFIQLDAGGTAYFNSKVLLGELPKRGDRVECVVVPGRDKRFFTLSVQRVSERSHATPQRPAAPSIGVATMKGSGSYKYVNDDAFLVHKLASGDTWLLAIADGVSSPPHGWWASDKCMELLWRSIPTYEAQLVQRARDERELMHSWINEIHTEFLREQERAETEHKQATSTLTFAVVWRSKDKKDRSDERLYIAWAHCGDTRLYILDPAKEKLFGAFSEKILDQRARTKEGHVGLANHIGANTRYWDGLVGVKPIPDGGLVLLCSDGVVSQDGQDQKYNQQKYASIVKGLSAGTDLQAQVLDVVSQIAALGETDDLTLIALRPGR